MTRKKGLFITFEGGEGSGKSTHARRLVDYLKGKGYPVIFTREPGGTEIGEMIRSILLKTSKPLTPWAEVLLFMADRAQHVEGKIRPALRAGKIVICDRYLDSTVAYQIGGRRLGQREIDFLNRLSAGGLKPDLTFLLDIEVKEGLRRARRSKKKEHSLIDRFEGEEAAFHRRIRRSYLNLARREPRRIRAINTVGDEAATQHIIRQTVDNILR